MQINEEKMAQDIATQTPTLSPSEKAVLWTKVEAALPTTSVVSPYSFFAQFKKQGAPIALALVALLSTTGLVAASEPARPGDSLFTIDQSIENIRLALASEDEKTRLEAEFAAERLLELSSILEEALADNKENRTATTSDQTRNDTKVNDALAITLSYFASSRLSDTDKDNLYTDLAKILEGSPVKIDDRRLRLLNDDSKIEIRSNDSLEDKRIEIRDGEDRMRIREKNGELRIEVKGDWDDEDDGDKDKDNDKTDKDAEYDEEDDRRSSWDDRHKNSNDNEDAGDDNSRDTIPETEIDTNLFDDDSQDRHNDDNEDISPEVDDDTEENRSDSDDQADDSANELKIEARVEDGWAEVRIEQDSNQSEFSFPYTTEAGLIMAIALKTGLPESAISGALDLEFKD